LYVVNKIIAKLKLYFPEKIIMLVDVTLWHNDCKNIDSESKQPVKQVFNILQTRWVL